MHAVNAKKCQYKNRHNSFVNCVATIHVKEFKLASVPFQFENILTWMVRKTQELLYRL